MSWPLAALKAIPAWMWLFLAAAGVIWWQHSEIQDERAEKSDALQAASQAQARASSLRNTLALQRDLQNDQNQVVNNAREQADANRILAANAGRRADGLQQQVNQLRAAAKARDAAAACGSSAAGQVSDVLAGLLDESVRRNRDLAEEAERYRSAGIACEAINASLVRQLGAE